MSLVSAFFHGFLILLVSNVIVNGSFIRLSCRYPNSELCKILHRNSINRYPTATSHNLVRATGNDIPLLLNTIDEDIQQLKDQLEALTYRHTVPETDDLVRCINLGDDSCNNGSIPGSGKDDDYLIGNGNPGKRSPSNSFGNCLNLGDDGCINGSLPGSGKDNDFLIGSGSPGIRSY